MTKAVNYAAHILTRAAWPIARTDLSRSRPHSSCHALSRINPIDKQGDSNPLVLILSLVICGALAMIIHELGHLVAARRCNVRASELGLGLGPRLFGFHLGSIRFSFRALPVGSFVMLDGTALEERTIQQQLLVHLGGIIFNMAVGLAFFGTIFGWANLLLAVGNLLPLYQHDGWKCGVVIMRALLRRKSQPIERVFTFSGGFLSLVFAFAIIRVFI